MSKPDKVSSFLSNLPAFNQMVVAQKEVIAEAQAKDTAAAAEDALRQTKLQSCIDAAYLIASADSSTGANEVSQMADKMSVLTSGEISADDVRKMLAIAEQKAAKSGRDGLIEEIAKAASDEDERETTFTVAAAVSWTGGGIGVKEGLALQALSKAFGWEINHMHKILARAHG